MFNKIKIILLKKFKLLRVKNKGFSLADMLVGLIIAAVALGMSYEFSGAYIKSVLRAYGLIGQEETGYLVEKFFGNDESCSETLRQAMKGLPSSASSFVIADVFVQKKGGGYQNYPAEDYFPGLDPPINVQIHKTKSGRELAKIMYSIKKTGRKSELKSKAKSFYVEAARDSANQIQCSKNVGFCPAGYRHMMHYNETQLNPVSFSKVEELQPDGSMVKTLTQSGGLSCVSSSICSGGRWINDISCYDSCTDKQWQKGDKRYESLAGGEQLDKLDDIDVNAPWCSAVGGGGADKGFRSSDFFQHAGGGAAGKCCAQKSRIDDFCKALENPPPSSSSPPGAPPPLQYNEAKLQEAHKWFAGMQFNKFKKAIEALCGDTDKGYCADQDLSLPKGNYGQAVSQVKEASFRGLHLAYQTVHAQCEYNKRWHIIGAVCDEHPVIQQMISGASARPKNIWGRGPLCRPEYPPVCACNARDALNLQSDPKTDKNGDVISDASISVRDIFKGYSEPPDKIACGYPIRFVYDFEGKNPMLFTYECGYDKKFHLVSRDKYCSGNARKPKLDLLFIIDNSGSMGEEQANLANNLDSFIEHLIKDTVDFHVGIATTDFKVRYVFIPGKASSAGPDISDIKSEMKKAIRAGTSGSGSERAQAPIMRFFNEHSQFKRPKAAFGLFILSDEDDESYSGWPHLYDFLFRGENGYKVQNSEIFIGVNDSSSAGKFSGASCHSAEHPNNYRKLMTGFAKVKEVLAADPASDLAEFLDCGAGSYWEEELNKISAADKTCNPEDPLCPQLPKCNPCEVNTHAGECFRVSQGAKGNNFNEVDLCDPDFNKRLAHFGAKLSSLLQSGAPPERPAVLDLQDAQNRPEALENKILDCK